MSRRHGHVSENLERRAAPGVQRAAVNAQMGGNVCSQNFTLLSAEERRWGMKGAKLYLDRRETTATQLIVGTSHITSREERRSSGEERRSSGEEREETQVRQFERRNNTNNLARNSDDSVACRQLQEKPKSSRVRQTAIKKSRKLLLSSINSFMSLLIIDYHLFILPVFQ